MKPRPTFYSTFEKSSEKRGFPAGEGYNRLLPYIIDAYEHGITREHKRRKADANVPTGPVTESDGSIVLRVGLKSGVEWTEDRLCRVIKWDGGKFFVWEVPVRGADVLYHGLSELDYYTCQAGQPVHNGTTFATRRGIVGWLDDHGVTNKVAGEIATYLEELEPGVFEAYKGRPIGVGMLIRNIESHWEGRVVAVERSSGKVMLRCVHECGERNKCDIQWFSPKDCIACESYTSIKAGQVGNTCQAN